MQKLMTTFLLVGGMLSSAANAETIIIAVSGTEKFLPGDKYEDTASVSVPEGARITFLAKTGEIIALVGPFEGSIFNASQRDNAGQALTEWSALKQLIGEPDARIEVLGASRDIEGNIPPTPDVWHVSVDSSGPRCTPSSQLVFWRRNAEKSQTVSVRGESGSLKGLDWKSGITVLSLPKSFALKSGRMLVGIDGQLRDLEVHIAPQNINDAKPAELLNWLLEKKCNRQALALIKRVHFKASSQ
ncbi:MAG: hypothetical protein AAGA53_14775 [Pseudomonadota bacterium]